MTASTVRILTLLLLGAAAAIVLGASEANAVTPTFTIDQPANPAPLKANIGSQSIKVHWTYAYGTTGIEAIGGVAPTTVIQWDEPTCDQPGVKVLGALTQTIPLREGTGAPQPSVSGDTNFNVAATLLAPGLRPVTCSISGKVLAPGGTTQVTDSSPGRAQFQATVQYVGLLGIEVVTGQIIEGGPQTDINYEIKLTNQGNALTQPKFELLTEPEPGWLPVLPPTKQIGAIQQGAPSNQELFKFLVTTPHSNGWNNDETSFQLKITPVAAEDPSVSGSDLTVSLNSRVRGIYVPGPEPMLLVVAIVGAAAIVGLRRR